MASCAARALIDYEASDFYEDSPSAPSPSVINGQLKNSISTLGTIRKGEFLNALVERSYPYLNIFLANRGFIQADFTRFCAALDEVNDGMRGFGAQCSDIRAVAEDESIMRFYSRDGIRVFFVLFFDGDDEHIAQVNVSVNGRFYSHDGTIPEALSYFHEVLKEEKYDPR